MFCSKCGKNVYGIRSFVNKPENDFERDVTIRCKECHAVIKEFVERY